MARTVHDKLDLIAADISSIKEIQVKHEENLKEHMRRTALLEKEVKPIVKHVAMVKGAGVLLSILAVVAGIYRSLH